MVTLIFILRGQAVKKESILALLLVAWQADKHVIGTVFGENPCAPQQW